MKIEKFINSIVDFYDGMLYWPPFRLVYLKQDYILHGLFFVLWLHFYDNMVAYFYANAVLYKVLILNNKSIKNDVLRFVLFG